MTKNTIPYIVAIVAIPLAYYFGVQNGNKPTSAPDLTLGSPTPKAIPASAARREGGADASQSRGKAFEDELTNVLGLPASPLRDKRLSELFFEAGRQQKSLALKLAETLQGRLREMATTSILMGWAKVDPKGAWAYAVTRATGSGLEWTDSASPNAVGSLTMLTAVMFRDGDAAELKGLVNELPAGKGKDLITGMYTKLLAQYDPAAAMRYVSELEGPTKLASLRNIGEDLARENPLESAAWALKLPGEESVYAMSGVMGKWVSVDAPAAIDWVKSQTPSPALDRAIDFIISEASVDMVKNSTGLMDLYSTKKTRDGGMAKLTYRLSALERQLGIK
jgi:hypothetical protein